METNEKKSNKNTQKPLFKTEPHVIDSFSKEFKSKLEMLPLEEARTIVDNYYQIQELRKVLGNQIRAVEKKMDVLSNDSMITTKYFFEDYYKVERKAKLALDIFTSSQPVGVWLKEIMGIGPVISAGLLAYFDINKAPKPSCFWQYSGLNIGNRPWYSRKEAEAFVRQAKKYMTDNNITDKSQLVAYLASISNTSISMFEGKKTTDDELAKIVSMPPYNRKLKTLLWKTGQSFLKVCNKGSLYGRLIQERKVYEITKNEKLEYADQAANALKKKTFTNKKIKEIYESGKLPPGHIEQRCENHAVKIFVSHLWEAMYYDKYGKEPDFKVYPLDYETVQPNGDLVQHVEYIGPEIDYKPIIDKFKSNH